MRERVKVTRCLGDRLVFRTNIWLQNTNIHESNHPISKLAQLFLLSLYIHSFFFNLAEKDEKLLILDERKHFKEIFLILF